MVSFARQAPLSAAPRPPKVAPITRVRGRAGRYRAVVPDVTLAALGGWPAVIGGLMAGDDLDADEARAVIAGILEGEATPAQLAGFLVALRMKGETVAELTGAVLAMLDAAERVSLPSSIDAVDTCGTGGSVHRRRGAFNVSTMASFVIAGAGQPVCKHGNRGATSTSGSADLLEALGVVIDLGPDGVTRCVTEVGMGFCFAPRYHPSMRHAGPTRRELGVPTVFNVLGPLANPARVRRQIVGVGDPTMADRMIQTLEATGAERAMVVHGAGHDELTTTGLSSVHELVGGEVRQYLVDATELGLARATDDDLRGGDAQANVAILRRILDGEAGAHRDVVVLNAAAGLLVGNQVADLAAGVEMAGAAIDDGSASRVLEQLVAVSGGGLGPTDTHN